MKRVIAHGTRRVIGERKLMVALICIYLFPDLYFDIVFIGDTISNVSYSTEV